MQVGNIQAAINGERGTKFMPEAVDAFGRLAKNRLFWLDFSFRPIDQLLTRDSRLPDVFLKPDELIELSHFFALIIDSRSRYTSTHSSGVAAVARTLGEYAGMCPIDCAKMEMAGHLHDIGKLSVPKAILEKPAGLEQDELTVIQSHTYHTFHILNEIKGLEDVNAWASFHHETLDGKGYPFGHDETKLPTGSRILAVADVFTALSEDRPYRFAMSSDENRIVLQQMVEERQLDREIVGLLLENFEEINRIGQEAQLAAAESMADFWKQAMNGVG